VKNASFPLLIPEKLLLKEKEHVEGFSPEVAWVTHAGNSELSERLAIRPTSETIMYPAYAKWIRSHNDLPLRLNQWCSVVRWEFKNPIPFLRSREFHWQEGHTVFANKEEADQETLEILKIYEKTYKELLAIPCLIGRKSDSEKFAGANYSLSCEIFLPIGKAIQGCTSHHLGQNFSKAFDIKFLDKDEKEKFPFQNSWGFSTRSIGIMIMMHSDSKGLVIPPRIAENKLIIIPVLAKEGNEKILAEVNNIQKVLQEFEPLVDSRDQYSYGWKLNDAELKGYPLRIEIGKKELAEEVVTLVRRDTLDKVKVPLNNLFVEVKKSLEEMHQSMYDKAKKYVESNIVEEFDEQKIYSLIKDGKVVKTVFDGSKEAEEIIKENSSGKTLVIPFDSSVNNKKCPFTKNTAKYEIYLARSL
jgi:prolyl-tRNA synthetase